MLFRSEETSPADITTAVNRLVKARESADADKETLAIVVRKLLVCGVSLQFGFKTLMATGGTRH